MPGFFDFLMGRDQQSPFLTPGYNPDAAPTGMAGQGGGFAESANNAFNSPLFHIGLGLLSTGRYDQGIPQGLMSYNQNRTANERRGLLGLQQQQLQAAMADLQRKRGQASQFRNALQAGQIPGVDAAKGAQLAQLPDEQLISTFATLAAREPPKPTVVNGKVVDPKDPTKVLADYSSPEAPLAVPDDKSPTGFRYVPRSQAMGMPALGPQGLALEFGPDGRPTGIRMGAGVTGRGADASGLAKPTVNALEEQALASSNALARLDQIQRSYRPEYQQFSTRGANWWTAAREKMGANISPAERQQLGEFSQFRRDAIQVVNQTIKDITGAAMSVPEAERISKQVPNVGSGIFDGDSPTEFEAKLQGVTRDTRNALLRANWARAKGLDPLKTGVELSEVPALINKRGNEIAAEVKAANPKADEQAIRQLVRQRLGREFGMLQ